MATNGNGNFVSCLYRRRRYPFCLAANKNGDGIARL